MLTINILNVALGLILTWTVFSVVAMYIQEVIASSRRWRSKMLETTIGNLLTDPGLLQQFYNHPVIQSLYTGKDGEKKPSYIPSGQFVQAFLDIISTGDSEASLLQQQIYSLSGEILGKRNRKKKQAQIQLGLILALIRRGLVTDTGSDASNSILDSATTALQTFAVDFPWTRNTIKKILTNVSILRGQIKVNLAASTKGQALLPESKTQKILTGMSALSVTHPRLKQTLDALLVNVPRMALESETGLEQIRQNIEEWYKNSMDRLTGWYRRRTQLTTLLIGLVMAVVINADTLVLADRFWNEPAQTDALLMKVESLITANSDENLSLTDQSGLSNFKQYLGTMGLPLGWLGASEMLGQQGGEKNGAASCALFSTGTERDVFGILVNGRCYPVINAPLLTDATGWILKAIGLMMTGLAISQGAPFWFDILKKIVNVRFAGIIPSDTVQTFG